MELFPGLWISTSGQMRTAGDAEDFRSDEAGFLGRKEDIQAGEFHRLSGPFEGCFLPEFRQVLLQLTSGHLEGCPDGAGGRGTGGTADEGLCHDMAERETKEAELFFLVKEGNSGASCGAEHTAA